MICVTREKKVQGKMKQQFDAQLTFSTKLSRPNNNYGMVGRVNFCQKYPNLPAEIFYCVFGCTDQPQNISG